MFVRASTVLLSIAAGALTVPGAAAGMPASQCDTGPLQCCENTMNSSNAADLISSMLGVATDALNLSNLVGFNCNSILPVIGTASGADCTQDPVCCENVYQNGLVNLGCTPVDIDA